jgi:hypothetical protein
MSFYLKGLIERDKTILKLESEVFLKLKDISGPEDVKNVTKFETKVVSFEDAIKELLNIRKSS